MTAKLTASADGSKVLIGTAAENALEIDATTKTIKALSPYLFNVDNMVPAGTIIDFAGSVAPSGYLACPLVATNISRATYAALFAAIGTTWGAGDGTTTFGMPWFAANYAAVQASANVGTNAAGENLSHTHAGTTAGMNSNQTHSHGTTKNIGPAGPTMQNDIVNTQVASNSGPVIWPTDVRNIDHLHSFTTAGSGGSANLAAGVRVMKCVKV